MHCPCTNGLDSMDCRFLLVVTSPRNLPSSLLLHDKRKFIIPWQFFPSPVYPALQVQRYDPRVLEQLALMSHTGVEAPHSSMSRTTSILIDKKKLLKGIHSGPNMWRWEYSFLPDISLFSLSNLSFFSGSYLNLSCNFSSFAASVTKYETFKSVV